MSRGHFLDPQKWVPFLCIFSHTVRSSGGGAAANEEFNIDQSQPSTIHSRRAHASTNYAGPFMRPCFCLRFLIFKLGAKKRQIAELNSIEHSSAACIICELPNGFNTPSFSHRPVHVALRGAPCVFHLSFTDPTPDPEHTL